MLANPSAAQRDTLTDNTALSVPHDAHLISNIRVTQSISLAYAGKLIKKRDDLTRTRCVCHALVEGSLTSVLPAAELLPQVFVCENAENPIITGYE
jgi:hypothetical protein